MMVEQKQSIERLESLLKQGKIQSVQGELARIDFKKIDNSERARWSRLSRKARLPELAIEVLFPICREEAYRTSNPGDEALTEYAIALEAVGAKKEAARYLDRVNGEAFPKGALVSGFFKIRHWDWTSALTEFDKVLAHPTSGPDEQMTARIFRASSMIFGRDLWDEGDAELAKIQKEIGPDYFRDGFKSTLILRAQVAIKQLRVQDAETFLAEYSRLCAEDRLPSDRLYLLQWQSILNLRLGRDEEKSLAQLDEVVEGFKRLRRFENARACEFYRVHYGRQESEAHKYFLGTPHEGYRRWLLKTLPPAKQDEIRQAYPMKIGTQNGHEFFLDIRTGESDCSPTYLKSGQLLQRLLSALCADLVAPPTVAGLHDHIYPEENFDPKTSPNRVHQALFRLRRWLEKSRIPLLIVEKEGFYRLDVKAGYQGTMILPGSDLGVAGTLKYRLDKLKSAFDAEYFSAKDAADALNCSGATARRLLLDAKKQDLVHVQGAGPSTRYQILEANDTVTDTLTESQFTA
jgi:hypothetical protein